MTRLLMLLSKLLQKHRKMKKWKRIVTTLAAVVTFVTTYALILPAITVEKNRADEVAGLYLEEGTAGEAEAIHPDEGNVDRAGDMYPEQEAAAEIMTLKAAGSDYTVILSYDETSNVPEGATLAVSEIAQDSEEYKTYLEETKKAMGYAEEDTLPRYAARFFDIKIMDGDQEFTPESGVSVEISYDEPLAQQSDAEVCAVHFADDAASAEVIEANAVEPQNEETSAVEFTAESFSVYGVIYTVDFAYSVNGKMYQFSLPGGGFVSFTDLVEVLGIIGDTNSEGNGDETESEIVENAEENAANDVVEENSVNFDTNTALTLGDVEVSEATRKFVSDVASVEFSTPSLVDVSKVEADTTVGQIKKSRGLECQYSAELTEEQIAEINAQTVEAGDWALISVQPFTSEETLTVTMKNGEVFTVKVTDAQISTLFLSDSGELYEVTVTYGSDAQIPDGATLKVTEFAEGSDDYRYAWKTVLADKQARDEEIDFSNLSALDISILDAEGNEIEPAAPVQVDLTIKSLPGVEDLSEVADTLAIQHHVETEDGIVVETVYDGGTEASFRMDTNEAVAAEGKVVDPDAADLSAFEFSSFDLYSDGSIVTNAPETEDDEIEVSFPTPVFSTFTVTWNNNSTTSNQLRVSQLSNGKYILYARDAANNNFYALVPGTALNSVQVTVNGDLVQYSGSENLYWDVETSGSGDNQRIYFSFTQDGTKYYLAAGTTGNKVTTNRNRNGYGNANTTEWRQWDNCIHSAGDTFLQSYNGTFRTWNVAGIYPFQDRSAVYFEKQGAGASNSSATIHYVDENGNELTVSNGQPVNDTNGNLNYLIYDVNSYEYAYTYRNANAPSNRITPILRYRNNRWQYTTGTDRDGNNSWTNLSQDDDIYVVYKPKASVPEGGTPVPKITGERPDTPTITKDSMVNGDGTNTLSLSVTGHTSIMEAEKLADVIVVYDVSGSMRFRMDSETDASVGQRRMDYAQAATKALAESLLGKNTTEHPDLIRMALISFSNTAQKVQDFTADKTTFTDAVDDLPAPDGGTNWEYALQIANEMAVESDRATFVIFVTDGNPTFRQTRGTLNNSSTNNGLGVTQYNASLGYTVGDVGSYFYQYRVYGGGDNDDWGRNYAAALVQAKSIVSHSKNFYTIGISNDVTNLTKLTTEAGAGADHSKTATSNEELVAAFDDIAASIIAHLGHSDVKITDGITALTQTVQKSTLVNFAEDDFTYSKERLATAEEISDSTKVPAGAQIVNREGTKYVVWNNWDPTSEGCARAVYNTTTGAVEWNMGETFMLEDGYTYQVRFKVWPSQAAYDLLADLNNGVKTYASLSESEKAQIKEPTTAGGMYTLKTNSDTSYTYREATKSGDTVTPTGEPSEPGSFPDVDPLELTTKPLKVKKQWHNNYVDSRALTDSITMELYGVDPDGVTSHDFKTITLKGSEGWYAENNYVSYGLVTYNTTTNAGAKIYETGHDFTLRETDDEAHYYELTAGVFRPMFINGTPTILEKMDAAPAEMSDSVFHYSDGSHHYYRLDGKIYRDTQSDVLLIATNTHRSYMDLKKVVVDESGNEAVDDTEFEYKITFTVPSGIANYDTVEKYIWFSVYDSVNKRTLAPAEYTCTGAITPVEENAQFSGDAYANYLVAISGQPMTLKIKQGWNVRFLNLPIGTTYSFEETNIPEGYSFVKAEVSGTRWIANMVDGTDQGSAQTMTSLPSNISGNNSNTGISGKIAFANARYSTAYTNKAPTQHVIILKTSQAGSTPLSGAVFSLYTENGYNAAPKQAAKTDLTSGADGKIDLGRLTAGKYYLVENSAPAGYILLAEPVEIIVTGSGVTYNQSNSSLSQSGNGISHEKETDPYTLTVINNAGYELPSTGGPGTRLFTILGSILILGAGVLLWRRRRTI